jgi:hypothetical protein
MDTATTIVLIVVGSIIGLAIQYWIIRTAVEHAFVRGGEELAETFRRRFAGEPSPALPEEANGPKLIQDDGH